eukprot:1255255-Amphidinium_carterae.1
MWGQPSATFADHEEVHCPESREDWDEVHKVLQASRNTVGDMVLGMEGVQGALSISAAVWSATAVGLAAYHKSDA